MKSVDYDTMTIYLGIGSQILIELCAFKKVFNSFCRYTNEWNKLIVFTGHAFEIVPKLSYRKMKGRVMELDECREHRKQREGGGTFC